MPLSGGICLSREIYRYNCPITKNNSRAWGHFEIAQFNAMNVQIPEGLKVPFTQPQNLADVAKASSPGILYSFLTWIIGVPIEKWVSAASLVLILLQIYFLIRDRLKKRRAARKAQA